MTQAMTAPRLEDLLEPEDLAQVARALAHVDHAGTTCVVFHHDPSGAIAEVEIEPATRKIKTRRLRRWRD